MVQLYREECPGIALPLLGTLALSCLIIVLRRVLSNPKTPTYIPTLSLRQTTVIGQKIEGSLSNN